MKKLGVLAATAVLLLTGCAAAQPNGSDAEKPSAAEEVAPSPTPTTGQIMTDEYTPDQIFLMSMDRYWQGDDRPAAADLIASAEEVCSAIAAGTPEADISVVEGVNNADVVRYAQQIYCPA